MSDPALPAPAVHVRPGEIVVLVVPPPTAVAQVVRRCRAGAPELVVVDATAEAALGDLARLRRLPRAQRGRLGIAVLVVTDDVAVVAGLVDRTLPVGAIAGPGSAAPTELAPGRPLLLSDVEDDVAYFGVLDAVPGNRPGRFSPPRLLRSLTDRVTAKTIHGEALPA